MTCKEEYYSQANFAEPLISWLYVFSNLMTLHI
jgi:hypothetical protein